MTLDPSTVAGLRALNHVLNKRIDGLSNLRPEVQLLEMPPPQVHNTVNVPEYPAPVVNLDLEGVAQALLAVGRSMAMMADAHDRQAAQLARLIDALAEQKAPTYSPRISVEQPNITVQPAPMPPNTKPRSIVIKHSDGTRSTVTEE